MLDSIDQRVLDVLRADGRISYRDLGGQVGLSAPAVTERVRRLERRGVITGYTANVDAAALGAPILAIIRVHSAGPNAPAVEAVADSLPEVIECHRVTGSESHVVRAWCRDLAHLDQLIEAFRQYGETITNVVTSTPVHHRSARFW